MGDLPRRWTNVGRVSLLEYMEDAGFSTVNCHLIYKHKEMQNYVLL